MILRVLSLLHISKSVLGFAGFSILFEPFSTLLSCLLIFNAIMLKIHSDYLSLSPIENFSETETCLNILISLSLLAGRDIFVLFLQSLLHFCQICSGLYWIFTIFRANLCTIDELRVSQGKLYLN